MQTKTIGECECCWACHYLKMGCRKDIQEILEDLSMVYMLHGDMRPNNVVRAPEGTARCKRHDCVHKWNMIDLAWTHVDYADGDILLRTCTLSYLQRRCFGSYSFWHGPIYDVLHLFGYIVCNIFAETNSFTTRAKPTCVLRISCTIEWSGQ